MNATTKAAWVHRALSAAALLAIATGARAQHEGHDMPGMVMPAASASATGTPAAAAASAGSPTIPSRSDPATPRPPENTSGPTSMPVSDNMVFHQVFVDRLEYAWPRRGSNGLVWDVQGWIGRDYNRLWIKTEGERRGGRTGDARVDVLWARPIAAFWDLQAGVRHDFGGGPARDWVALGIQGLAPYWFDLEATGYVGSSGRTALRLHADYDVVLSQRTFLAPEAEANFYGRSDPARGIGSGLSDLRIGIRLRHELRREFAPYVGWEWNQRFGTTAQLARSAGEPTAVGRWVAGVRAWF